MNSEEIIVGIFCLFLVIAFFLFKPQFFNLLNHLTRINVRGAKNLHYTDENVEPELSTPSLFVLSREKIFIRVIVFLILSFLIYTVPAPLSKILIDFGNSEYSTGNEKLGTVSYNLALEFDNELKKAMHQCNANNAQKEYKQAIEDCGKAIEINEHYASAYFSRGNAYLGLKQYDQAIADFTKDIEVIPIATRSYINRGGVYMQQGKYDLAAADFTKSIEINPQEPQAWLNRGLANYQQNKNDLAISDCNRAIQLEEKYWNAYLCLGLAFANQGKYELAMDNFNKATEFIPNTSASVLYCVKGITYTRIGNFESAITSLEQGVKLDSANENDWCKSALENARKGISTP